MDLNNKFLDKPVLKTKRDRPITSFTQQNWAKNMVKDDPEDIEMDDVNENEEEKHTSCHNNLDSCDITNNEEMQIQETKEIRAQRRKAILKELEV